MAMRQMTVLQARQIKSTAQGGSTVFGFVFALMPLVITHPFFVITTLLVMTIVLVGSGFTIFNGFCLIGFCLLWLLISSLCIGNKYLVKALDILKAKGE